ncbi:MAG TPA: signal recognition particle-docking protein FtsY, partial [Ornithinibacter sp.]|nr:signal recognition particle-docking protein FtsY [Ornithinibacter sp.]
MSAIDTLWEYLAVAVGIIVVIGGIAVGLMRSRGGRTTKDLPPASPGPGPGGSAVDLDAAPEGAIGTLERPTTTEPEPELLPVPAPAPTPTLERPEAPAGRLRRLRARLARSNTALGKGLLALLSGGTLDEAAWE